jgi:succinate dehydrogenase cytochrome b subunit
MPQKNNRPVFLNLAQIRLPISAMISIAHRIAGIVLFISIPFAIYLLDLSLTSQIGYNHVEGLLGRIPIKLMLVLIFWALGHHVFAGVRVLLIDLGIGVEREESKRTAWVVAVGSIAILFMIAGILLW